MYHEKIKKYVSLDSKSESKKKDSTDLSSMVSGNEFKVKLTEKLKCNAIMHHTIILYVVKKNICNFDSFENDHVSVYCQL